MTFSRTWSPPWMQYACNHFGWNGLADGGSTGIAMKRARVIAFGKVVAVDSFIFNDTYSIMETSALDTGSSIKIYAIGIGLAVDEGLQRIE